ncbi:MAG TPA: hypothetical protein VNQ90_00055 [Chthoniobacteraceae bacterium]|nr:hypothetical protein [Chthoniobacteraceae bacterium]
MIWTKSIREEILTALWLIVALLAKIASAPTWFSAGIYAYASFCFVLGFCYAVQEEKNRKDQP